MRESHGMLFRITSLIVLLAFANYSTGCVIKRSKKVSKEQIAHQTEKIVEVVFPSGEVIKFDPVGGRIDQEKHVIFGVTEEGKRIEIGMDEILYARVSKTDVALSTLATVGVIIGVTALTVGALVLLVAVLKESCPFVYSFDGEKYIFDAEPLGGAISSGLKKDDFSRLEHLKPVNGKYHLLLRNEVEETQYLDEIKLLVVDHPINSEVMPDLTGNMHSVRKPVAPTFALDENGKDIMKFVKERDDIAWQTHLATASSLEGRSLRHQLTFEFPKPREAKTAKLVINAGTALWGSNMIREMLQLRGNKVDEWYEGINKRGPELMELIQFIEREELYLLKIYIQKGETWVEHGFIPGGGPLIIENRVINLDLSDVQGDTLAIQINPPMGFWTIDSIGIEYANHLSPEPKVVALASAQGQYGEDVSELLRATDSRYLVLSEVGEWAKVNFDVPPQRAGTKRSVFLKTSGYYEIHLLKDQPEQTKLIHQLLTTPGMIVEFSMNEYRKWRSLQVSLN